MTCQRCHTLRGDPALFRIRSEVIDLTVCASCAQEALDLDLICQPIETPEIFGLVAGFTKAA